MTRDPIRRRFGHGAAKLRVGLPPGAARLAELARTKVRLERRLTIVPFLTAVAVIWLLATSPPIRVPEDASKPSELELVLQSWPVRRTPTPIVPPTDLPRVEDAARSRPPAARPAAGAAAPPSAVARRAAPAEPTPPKSAAPFDPGALATRGAAWTEPEVLASAAVPAAATPTFSTARAPRARPSDLAPIASTETLALARAARIGADGQATPVFAATPRAERPGGGGAPAGASRALVEATAEGARSRQAALAAIEAADEAKDDRGSRPVDRRPAVSAPRMPTRLLEGEAASSGRGSGVAGWEEVPLDALPDCDPPGRQDLLKKRILLAAAVQRECSHPSGSYRFVETRSLGAFLMWSRPDPHAGAGQPRDRDACDVLERALACLGDRSSQESQWR